MRKRHTLILGLAFILAGIGHAYPFPGNYAQENRYHPEQLEALRIWKMTQYLDLSETQAAKFFPALQAHQEEIAALDSTERLIQRNIHDAIEAGGIDQQFIDNKIDSLITIMHAKETKRADFFRQLPQYLNPEQQAKFLIFDHRFRQALKSMIRRRDDDRR